MKNNQQDNNMDKQLELLEQRQLNRELVQASKLQKDPEGLRKAICFEGKYAIGWLNDFLKEHITSKEYKLIKAQINALLSATPSPIVLQATLIIENEIKRKQKLLRKIKYIKWRIKHEREYRKTRKQGDFNNACRLSVLARDAVKFGLLTFENFSYLWNNLQYGKPGLNNDLINTLHTSYFSKLSENHPLYSNIQKAEERIKMMLVKLDFEKPFIP